MTDAVLTFEDLSGTVSIRETTSGRRSISVRLHDSRTFSPRTQWTTRYPVDLIHKILLVKGAAWLCDEIARDEDPDGVESDIRASVLGYVTGEEVNGSRVLDFGCGSGASSMVLARLFPSAQICGIELVEDFLTTARQRAEVMEIRNVSFHLSPAPDRIPDTIGPFDHILLSAVFEHLLPHERAPLMQAIWDVLAPGGILFINQTPDSRFPAEVHTTGLPLMHYLPDSAAFRLARTLSRRGLAAESDESLLRKGIRGSTPAKILRLLADNTPAPVLLRPRYQSLHRQSDIWYRAARARLASRGNVLHRKVFPPIVDIMVALAIPIAPYLSIAVQKPLNRIQSQA